MNVSQDSGTQPEEAGLSSPVPLAGALQEGIKRLGGHPIPLFIVCAGIILSGAAVWGLEPLRVLTLPLLILFIGGLLVWGGIEVLRTRRPSARGGSIRLRAFSGVEDSNLRAGDVVTSAQTPGDAVGGDVSVGAGARVRKVKGHAGGVRQSHQADDDEAPGAGP